MKPSRRSGAIVLGALSIGIASLLVWGLGQDPTPPWQRLPDGSQIRVLGTTYGTKHRIVEGQTWQRLLLPIWPQVTPPMAVTRSGVFPVPLSGGVLPITSRTTLLGGLSQEYETPKPRLVVWLRYRDAQNRWGGRLFRGEDEHGCPCFCNSLQSPDYGDGGSRIALEFNTLPRHSSTLRLRPVDQSLAALTYPPFSVPLPNLGPQPVWQPQPLPQPAQNGPFKARMLGWVPRQLVPMAEFAVGSGGKADLGWEPVTLTVSDATGNALTSFREQQYQPDPRRFQFLGLCTRETAWKLHTEFAPAPRPRPAGRPDRNWSPAPAAAPSWRWIAKIRSPRAERAMIGGPYLRRPELMMEIVTAAVAGPASDPGWGTGPLRCAAVRVRLSDTRETVRLTLVRVTDERGRSTVPTWQESPLEKQWDSNLPRPSQLFRPGTQERNFVLPALPNAKTLRLEFVAHRVVPVDFLVVPPSLVSFAIKPSEDK
jgi:hypothetical protein